MGAFGAIQPNGLYCRFSSVVDTVTHWNLSKEEYSETYSNLTIFPFEEILNSFTPLNNTVEEFNVILKEMGFRGKFEYVE